MELKLSDTTEGTLKYSLLIVPYGIETVDGQKIHLAVEDLLIVPYGIET